MGKLGIHRVVFFRLKISVKASQMTRRWLSRHWYPFHPSDPILPVGNFIGSLTHPNMGLSINGGTPNMMGYNRKSHLNGWFGGTPISGNLHIHSGLHSAPPCRSLPQENFDALRLFFLASSRLMRLATDVCDEMGISIVIGGALWKWMVYTGQADNMDGVGEPHGNFQMSQFDLWQATYFGWCVSQTDDSHFCRKAQHFRDVHAHFPWAHNFSESQ